MIKVFMYKTLSINTNVTKIPQMLSLDIFVVMHLSNLPPIYDRGVSDHIMDSDNSNSF